MTSTEAEMAADLRERMSRRAVVRLSEADLLRLADLNSEYTVAAVYARPEVNSIEMIVLHPGLRPVMPGVVPPSLDGAVTRELRVIEGKVWFQSRLAVDAPETVIALNKQQILSDLALELSTQATTAEDVLAILRRGVQSPGAPYRASAFLDWLAE